MSSWKDLEDEDDISFSEDRKTIYIRYGSDDFGNNYIEIPVKLMKEKLEENDAKKEDIEED